MKTILSLLFAIMAFSIPLVSYAEPPSSGTGSAGEDGVVLKYTPLARAPLRLHTSSGVSWEQSAISIPYEKWSGYAAERPKFMQAIASSSSFGGYTPLRLNSETRAILRAADVTVRASTTNGSQFAGPLVLRSSRRTALLNGLSFEVQSPGVTSAKPLGTLGFSGSFGQNSRFSFTLQGIDYVDGIKGNGNDITYTNGEPATTLVNEIVYRGVGNWFVEQTLANAGEVERHLATNQPYPVTVMYAHPEVGSSRGTFWLEPNAPPTPTLTVSVSVSPSGDVAQGTVLTLTGEFRNDGATTIGPLEGMWEISLNDGGTWENWVRDGSVSTLARGQSVKATQTWTAGPPDTAVYRFRLKVSTTSNPVASVFSPPTPAVRVTLPAQGQAPTLAITPAGKGFVEITIGGPPGSYALQSRGEVASGQWVVRSTLTKGAGAHSLTMGAGESRQFFRVQRVQ